MKLNKASQYLGDPSNGCSQFAPADAPNSPNSSLSGINSNTATMSDGVPPPPPPVVVPLYRCQDPNIPPIHSLALSIPSTPDAASALCAMASNCSLLEPSRSTTNTSSSLPPSTNLSESIPPSETPPSNPKTLDTMASNLFAAPDTDNVAFASATSVNVKTYALKKKKLVREFIQALSEHEKYKDFVKLTNLVPSHFTTPVAEEVFVQLSGTEDRQQKAKILSEMLVDWIGCKKKKSQKEGESKYPHPATINSTVRAFLAATKDMFNWHFSMSDFNFDGGYNGFFKALCAERQKDEVSTYLIFFHTSFHPSSY